MKKVFLLLVSITILSCQSDTEISNDSSMTVAEIENKLEAGETPQEIYASNPSIIDMFYGLSYAGGLIFHIDVNEGKVYISAPVGQIESIIWGCHGTEVLTALNTTIGTGELNTSNIVASCTEGAYAAKLCDDLILNSYNDWFLPSKDELDKMYINLKLNGYGDFNPTPTGNNVYWSSSDYFDNGGNYDAAWCQDFETGNQITHDLGIKYFQQKVRAVRIEG